MCVWAPIWEWCPRDRPWEDVRSENKRTLEMVVDSSMIGGGMMAWLGFLRRCSRSLDWWALMCSHTYDLSSCILVDSRTFFCWAKCLASFLAVSRCSESLVGNVSFLQALKTSASSLRVMLGSSKMASNSVCFGAPALCSSSHCCPSGVCCQMESGMGVGPTGGLPKVCVLVC